MAVGVAVSMTLPEGVPTAGEELPEPEVHPTIPLTPAERELVREAIRQEIQRWIREQE